MRHLEVRSYSSAGFLCSGCSLVARVAPPWWNFKLTQKAFVRVYFNFQSLLLAHELRSYVIKGNLIVQIMHAV